MHLSSLTRAERERLLKLAVSSKLKRNAEGLPAIIRVERSERLPLSYAQQRLWFLAQMEGGREAYHVSFGVRLKGELDHQALRQALDRIVARHEALRTRFVIVEGEPRQR